MKFPTARYASTEPDCPPGRKHICIGWLPEKRERVGPDGKKKHAWVWTVAVFHYGETPEEAEAKLRAWIEGVREAELKRGMRELRQQQGAAQTRARKAREAEQALWGTEEQGA